MKVSIIMPVYNERATIAQVIEVVLAAPLPAGLERELVIVDDGSTDGTRDYLRTLRGPQVIFHEHNTGKGGAVRTGFAAAKGDIFLIQDADMEYDPNDYPALLQPLVDGRSQVIYGSRRLLKSNRQHSGLQYYLGGVMLTWLTNALYGSRLTDEPTCYKVFTRSALRGLTIVGSKFEWEPEITAKLLRRGVRIDEVPIRYYPRTSAAGKKIRWHDGVVAIWTLIRYRFGRVQ